MLLTTLKTFSARFLNNTFPDSDSPTACVGESFAVSPAFGAPFGIGFWSTLAQGPWTKRMVNSNCLTVVELFTLLITYKGDNIVI